MPGTAGPNIGFVWGYTPGEDGWGVGGFNPNWAKADALTSLYIVARQDAPPGSPVEGRRYIVGDTPSGGWSGATTDDVAVYRDGGWVFYAPNHGLQAFSDELFQPIVYWVGSGWVVFNWINPVSAAENDILMYDASDGYFISVRPRHTIGFGGDPTAVLTADQEIMYYKFPVGVTFIDDFGDYRGWSTVAQGTDDATADVVLVVEKAVAATPNTFSAVGTLTIAAAGAVLTAKATTGGDLVFAKNDVIRILAPTSPDATFKGLFGTLVGFET